MHQLRPLHQDNENPAHFLFYENWESRELWQTHMNAQHLQDYLAATDGAVEEFTLNEMTRIAWSVHPFLRIELDMKYEGTVYRPWPEANSLLIQTTIGCTNNQCTFCNMFREKRFRVRDIDDVFEDVDDARRVLPHVGSIFLIDGNVMAVKTEVLLKLVDKINSTFPQCSKILSRAELSDEFAAASGRYFDNDSGRFAPPHPDALDSRKSQEIVRVIETVVASMGASSTLPHLLICHLGLGQ